jgi:hypothetical protein
MADDKSIISYDNIISPTETFDVLFSNLDNLEARLKKLAKGFNDDLKFINVNDTVAIEKQALALRKLELAEEKLRLKKEALANAQKKKIALNLRELVQIEKKKLADKGTIQRAKQLAIIETEKGRTIKSIRAQLSLTSVAWSKLTAEEIKNGKNAKIISKRKLDLTNELKKLEKQTGDTRRNVGNYTESLSKLGKTSARVFLGRSAVDFFRRIASGVKSLIEANKNGSESIGELDGSLNKLTGGLLAVATTVLEFVAPALTFLFDTATSLLSIFFDLSGGIDGFSATSSELDTTTKALNDEFKKEKGNLDSLFSSLGNANKGSEERKGIIDKINTQYGIYLPNLLTEKSSLEEIAAAQNTVNEALSKTFLLRAQQATQLDIFTNKANSTIAVFDEIKEALSGPISGGFENLSLSQFEDFVAAAGASEESFLAFKKSIEGELDIFGNKSLSESAATVFEFDPITGEANEFIETEIDRFTQSLSQLGNESAAKAFLDLVGNTISYNDAIEKTNSDIKSLQNSITTYDHATTKSTGSTSSNTKVLKDNTAERLKAIEELQVALEALEVGSIEDRQKRALALEDLRFKEEQKLRKLNEIEFAQLLKEQEDNLIDFYGKKDKRVIAFRAAADVELLKVEALSLRLSEEQLADSEENKIKILEDFDKKRIDRATKAVEQAQALIKKDADDFAKINKAITDEQQKSIQSEADLEQKARKEKNKKRIDDEKQLSKDIISLTSETSKAIQSVFDAEVKAAGDAVAAQVTAVSNAETRAKAGLENTLKFEQEQLASKELQRQQTEKRAKQAAEALALINLTVAAAQSGDKNAVQTGLVQFGVLKGLVAAIGSFYHGTEDTGTVSNPLDSNGGRLAVLHNNERVVTASDNKKLGGMTNKELTDNAIRGAAMTDHQNPSMSLGSNHYQEQTKKVLSSSQSTSLTIDVSGLKDEMRATRRAIEKKPVVQETITGIINDVVTVARKTTTNRMTKAEIIKKRL